MFRWGGDDIRGETFVRTHKAVCLNVHLIICKLYLNTVNFLKEEKNRYSTKVSRKTGVYWLPNCYGPLTHSEGERQTINSQGKAKVCETHNHTLHILCGKASQAGIRIFNFRGDRRNTGLHVYPTPINISFWNLFWSQE